MQVKEVIKKHMTPQIVIYIIGTAVYIACFVLMVYAPLIFETAAVSLGLGLPTLFAVITFIYAPSDRLKAALVAFVVTGIVILALVVTGYGGIIVELFVRLASIVQFLSCLVFVGVPLAFVYMYARKKGWLKQAEDTADKVVTDFFNQIGGDKN